MISATSKDSSNLTAAANELVKAACAHVEITSLSMVKDTLDEMKSLTTKVEALKVTFEAKIDTLNKSNTELKDEMVKLRQESAAQLKEQRLQWALDNASLNSFQYYSDGKGNQYESKYLVTSILLSFRRGTAYRIDTYGLSVDQVYKNGTYVYEAKQKKEFCDKLEAQLYDLIGTKPRIEQDNEKYMIWYS